MKGAVAAGHPETAKAAEEMLRAGGNAFDAVLSAHLAACVAEPVLSSLGGGGFLLAKESNGDQVLYDFFVQTPIQTKHGQVKFFPISADFGEVKQEFHIGPGSIATPGTVKGIFEIHKELCSMPLETITEPAMKLARNGVVMNAFQAGVFQIIKPIFLSYDEPKKLYGSREENGRLINEGEIFKLPDLADFMEELVREGERFFYDGLISGQVADICKENGGHLTEEDFKAYRVIKRKPLEVKYREAHISMNPPPSSGGVLIAFALKLLENAALGKFKPGSESAISLLAKTQEQTDHARINAFVDETIGGSEDVLLDPEFIRMYRDKIKPELFSPRGTTHISVIDGDGNVASLSTSNGEGSGVMLPGTGMMLNNMLGEEDLNPKGFHAWPPNERMTSMMAPGILQRKNGQQTVFGSGGSNRIRTAILQVILNLIDFEMSLEEAITFPRIHFEKDLLNVEHGFDDETLSAVMETFPNHKIWKEKSLFFGGTHAVTGGPDGFAGSGDPRRGGVSIVAG